MSLGALIRNDVRIQLRSGFHAAYAFVALTYMLLLRALPADTRALVVPPVLLSEAGVVGFMFAGAMLHFERDDGVLDALGVTPVGAARYVAARVASLALLNVLVALAVVIGGGVPIAAPAPLLAASILAAGFFTLLGLAVASRFTRIERFVVIGGLASAAFALPTLPYFGLVRSPLWAILPGDAFLTLLARAVAAPVPRGAAGTATLLLAGLILAAWSAAAFGLAAAWVERHAIGRERGVRP